MCGADKVQLKSGTEWFGQVATWSVDVAKNGLRLARRPSTPAEIFKTYPPESPKKAPKIFETKKKKVEEEEVEEGWCWQKLSASLAPLKLPIENK